MLGPSKRHRPQPEPEIPAVVPIPIQVRFVFQPMKIIFANLCFSSCSRTAFNPCSPFLRSICFLDVVVHSYYCSLQTHLASRLFSYRSLAGIPSVSDVSWPSKSDWKVKNMHSLPGISKIARASQTFRRSSFSIIAQTHLTLRSDEHNADE